MRYTAQIIHRVLPCGKQEWRLRGKLHRLDGPAIIHPDGAETWWVHGLRHRDGGPAIISPMHYQVEWWQHGQRHRDDGPAVVHQGLSVWFASGKKHRLGAPAILFPGGIHEWWVSGQNVSSAVQAFMRENGMPAHDALEDSQRAILWLFMSALC